MQERLTWKGAWREDAQVAQALAKGERALLRERVVGHGHGKNATQHRLRTEVVGVPALTSYES